MRRFDKEYSSYRGRRTLTDLLKLVAVVLAVLVVLVLAALWLGKDYVVRTEDGWRLELPFFQREEDPAGDVSQPGPEASQPDRSREEEPEPVEEPEAEPAMAALELPLSALLDGTAAALLEQAGANALVVEMKGTEGRLNWTSQQSLAAAGEINASDGTVNDRILAWNQGQVYTVAKVCCFRDNSLPYHRNNTALRADYGNWRDELGLRWLNPANADVQTYLAGLCGELAALGFDEILLDCWTFPVQGNLEALTDTGLDQAQAVDEFLAGVEEALAPYDTVLSLRVEREVLSGALPDGGLSAARLEAGGGRLWMTRDSGQPEPIQLLSEAGISRAEERLVEIVPALDGLLQRPQALLSGED